MKSKLFRILLIGIFIIGILACIGWVIFARFSLNKPNVTSTGEQTPTKYFLTDFSQIQGTPILIAEISVDYQSQRYSGSSRWFSFGASENARDHNLVFLDSKTLESHKLFLTNEHGILNVTQFPENIERSYGEFVPTINGQTVAEWLVYEIVMNDTNQDKLLNKDDLMVVSVSDVNGAAYTEILTGVFFVYGMEMAEYGKLVVTYIQNDRKLVSIIDLKLKFVLDTKELIDLGEDVR